MEQDVKLRTTQEKGFLRIAVSGSFPADIGALYTRVRTMINLSGQDRFLVDMRALSGWPEHKATHEYVSKGYPEPEGFRTAILALPQTLVHARFWETMIQSRGYDTRLFKDEEEAVAWLLG